MNNAYTYEDPIKMELNDMKNTIQHMKDDMILNVQVGQNEWVINKSSLNELPIYEAYPLSPKEGETPAWEDNSASEIAKYVLNSNETVGLKSIEYTENSPANLLSFVEKEKYVESLSSMSDLGTKEFQVGKNEETLFVKKHDQGFSIQEGSINESIQFVGDLKDTVDEIFKRNNQKGFTAEAQLVNRKEFIQILEKLHTQVSSAHITLDNVSFDIKFQTHKEALEGSWTQPFHDLIKDKQAGIYEVTVPEKYRHFVRDAEGVSAISAEGIAEDLFTQAKSNFRIDYFQSHTGEYPNIDLTQSTPLTAAEIKEILNHLPAGAEATLSNGQTQMQLTINGANEFQAAVQTIGSTIVAQFAEPTASLMAQTIVDDAKDLQLVAVKYGNKSAIRVIDNTHSQRAVNLLQSLDRMNKIRVFTEDLSAIDISRTGELFVARDKAIVPKIRIIGTADQVISALQEDPKTALVLAKDSEQWMHPLVDETLKNVLIKAPGMPTEKLGETLHQMVDRYRMGKNGDIEINLRGNGNNNTISLQKTPYLSHDKKSHLMDMAADNIKFIQQKGLTQSM